MKKAIMYGAGNIGRGFIGKVLSESGYEVCFLDISTEIVEAMNRYNEYNVQIVSDEAQRVDVVKNVRAVDANSPQAVEEIADCDLMATSVGVNVMKFIAPNIAKAIVKRMEQKNEPLDILLAENQMNADKLMRGWIYEHLDAAQKKWADENLGLVECSIGRMVPKLSPVLSAADPLLIAVEEYALLPVDSEGFKGEIPDLVGLVPFTPFDFHIKRKLFMHNMSHALCAYFGWAMGLEYISEAVGVPVIKSRAHESMMLVAKALNREYGVPMEELTDYVDDLLFRFRNKALRETISRVGADPIRKLRKDDRLVGAALYVIESGFDPDYIVKGIVAALNYADANDKSAMELQDCLEKNGVEYVIEHYMGLKQDELLAQMILKEFEREAVK